MPRANERQCRLRALVTGQRQQVQEALMASSLSPLHATLTGLPDVG